MASVAVARAVVAASTLALLIGCGQGSDGNSNSAHGGTDGGSAAAPSIEVAPQLLDGPDVSAPRVAVDGRGDALVAWERSSGLGSTVAVAALHDGAWQPVRELGEGSSPIPVLHADGSGFVVHTAEVPAGSTTMRLTRLVPYDGSDFGGPVDLDDNAWDMDAGVLDDGEAVVIMTGLPVRIHRFSSGAWSASEEPLPSTPAVPVYAPRLARSANGWLASWYEIVGDTEQIMVARGDEQARNFGAPQAVLTLMPHLGGLYDHCLLEASDSGSTIAAIRGSHDIQAAAFDPSASHELLVNDDTAFNEPTGPGAGIDVSGSGWVVWAREGDDGSNDWQIMARRFSPDGFQDEVVIDEDAYAPSARVALRSDGSALALWASVGLSGAIATDGAFGPSVRLLKVGLVDNFYPDSLIVEPGPAGDTVAAWRTLEGVVATRVGW